MDNKTTTKDSSVSYVAPEPIMNALWVTGKILVGLMTSQGYTGAQLFANPMGGGVLQLVPEADFITAGVPVDQKFCLVVQRPNQYGTNNVGMVVAELNAGATLKQSLL